MAANKPAFGDKYIKVSRRVADRLYTDYEIGLAKALLSLNPNHLNALRTLGNALTRAGRHEEALDVDLRIVELAPRDAYAYYNLTCSYSNLGYVDQALTALRQALKLGYRDFGYLMTDRDLESVRRDPRFKKLLDRKWGKRQP